MSVRRRGFIGALLFGAAFSLGWTPCLGPFLGSALMLAGARETVAEGVFYLFVFSMGLGVPYILAALFFTRIREFSNAAPPRAGDKKSLRRDTRRRGHSDTYRHLRLLVGALLVGLRKI